MQLLGQQWLIAALPGSLYWESFLWLGCVQALQKWVPGHISVVCSGWRECCAFRDLSSRKGRGQRWAAPELDYHWESRMCEHSASRHPVAHGCSAVGMRRWAPRRRLQDATKQRHMHMFSFQSNSSYCLTFLLSLPERIKSSWRLPKTWQNFPTDLPWVECWRNIIDFLRCKVSAATNDGEWVRAKAHILFAW